MRRLYLLLILLFILPNVFAQKILREEYILLYKDIAISEMKRTGIPASIKLAQAILESDGGNSRLAVKANNHFGIKCGSKWQGKTIGHDDDKRGECFRVYDNPEGSYRDHSDFLVQGSRYASLFNLKSTDYKGWSRGLKAAGYATAKDYDSKLIRIIETHKLYIFDSDVTAKKTKPVKEIKKEQVSTSKISDPSSTVIDIYGIKGGKINNVDFIYAKKGDTWKSLADAHNKLPWELYSYNDVSKKSPPEIRSGQVIFLQPKRRKANRKFKAHSVTSGETMWSISQQYGIKLKRLYKMNRMPEGSEVKVGETLYLRKTKPE